MNSGGIGLNAAETPTTPLDADQPDFDRAAVSCICRNRDDPFFDEVDMVDELARFMKRLLQHQRDALNMCPERGEIAG